MSTLSRNDVALWLDGNGWSGWSEVVIDRGIDAVAGGFSLKVTDRTETGGPISVIAAGASCRVSIGSQTLITGFIDTVNRSIDSESRAIEVQGRDLAGDLVDCSAMASPGMWRDQKLEVIAREIAAPFGIGIVVTADTGKPFARFAIQQGETAWTAIERMARYRGVIAWSLGDGSIRIGNPDTGKVAGQIIQGENVLSAASSDDQGERFSDYTVKGQASGNDHRSGRAAAQVVARAQDSGIKRHRPLLVIAEEQADTASLWARAAWEAQTRAARGQKLQVTVPGWFAGNDQDGPIWQPGSRAYVRIPGCNVDRALLIERVRLSRDAEGGTTSELVLAPPEAWAQLAEPEPKQ